MLKAGAMFPFIAAPLSATLSAISAKSITTSFLKMSVSPRRLFETSTGTSTLISKNLCAKKFSANEAQINDVNTTKESISIDPIVDILDGKWKENYEKKINQLKE